jgi:LytS/YehU family sensor histidine kinase
VIGFIIAYLIVLQSRLKHTQKTMMLEQKLLRTQMNPHFIFNALIAIESFIYKNEPKEAGKYLSGFARLMRLILENSREEFVSLEKEISTLKYYLDLQRLRYDNAFNYDIRVDKDIDINSITIPPMLAQPFIENSIEHGLKDLNRSGEIVLNFSLKENELIFEAVDNGIGFERSMQLKNEGNNHKSMATVITLERLKNLNRNKIRKIKWLSEDIKDQLNNVLGSRVVFTIPFKEI